MHRLLRPGGRLAFTTIHLAPGLTRVQRRRASVSGPPAVIGPDGRELLHRAGFDVVQAEDVTADFLATATAWRATRIRHRDRLRPLDPEAYEDRIATNTAEIRAVGAGLLRRSLYVATRPKTSYQEE
jgi:hypothetical protein